eukprot:1487209-Pleurochrysis_carterae.AAC.3
MLQVCASEEVWHDNSTFATPAKLRLQQQLRTRRLKCDLPDQLRPERVRVHTLFSVRQQKLHPLHPLLSLLRMRRCQPLTQ